MNLICCFEPFFFFFVLLLGLLLRDGCNPSHVKTAPSFSQDTVIVGYQPDLPLLLVRQITNVFAIFHLFYAIARHDLDHVRRIHPDVRAGWEERNGRQGHRYFYGGREDESSCGKAAAQGTLKESAAGLVHFSVPEVTTCWSLIRRTLQHWRLHKAN